MSLKTCIRNAYDQQVIGLEEKQRLEKRYDDLVKSIPSTKQAKEIMIAELEAQAKEKERVSGLAEIARRARMADIFGHRNAYGQQDPAQALKLLVENFGEGRMMDVSNLRDATVARYQSKLDKLLVEFEKGAITGDRRRQGGWVGNKRVITRLENVVKELFGEDTKDPTARALAGSVAQVFEEMRQEFNALGGNIGKLERYGLPQSHDPESLLKFGKQPWVDHLMKDGVLDRERMTSQYTGHPLTDFELKEALGIMWERVTTNGWYDREVGMVQTGKGALYKQHQDHRFIHFKSADQWLKYAKDFGGAGGDPFNAMMSHISGMSRDIAAMTVFGPNPTAMRAHLTSLVKQHVEKSPSSIAVRAEQELELSKIGTELAQYGGRQGWETAYDALFGAYKKIRREVEAARNEGNGGARVPLFFKGRSPEPDTIKARSIADKLSELDAAYQRFNDWLDANKNPDDVTMQADVTARIVASRERMQEIFDDLREEITLPSKGQNYGSAIWQADQMWGLYTGSLTTPVSTTMANVFTNIRNVLVAARLDRAILSAVTDPGFQTATRSFMGMPNSHLHNVIGDMTKMLSAQSREEMIRSRMILDTALHGIHQQARYSGSLNTNAITGYLADRAIHMQGLAGWTQYGKWAFGMELQGFFSDLKGKSWGELPEPARNGLDRHGFTSADWDRMRSAPSHYPDVRAAGMLRPNDIEAVAGKELADKYLMMILRERRRAVPEPTLAARAIMTGGVRPGSILGESIRSATQFKSFAVSVGMLHGGRMMNEYAEGGARSAARYMVPLMITTTMLGAVAIQLKEMVGGRDPRKLDDHKFWAAALIQGGGLGILGDFLNSAENRFGGGLTSTVAGPMAGEIDKLLKLTLGNVIEADGGKTTNIGREFVDAIQRNTPLAGLPGINLATEHLIFDKMHKALDPDRYKAVERRIKNRQRDYGVGFWWEPGASAPRSGPDLGGMVGKK